LRLFVEKNLPFASLWRESQEIPPFKQRTNERVGSSDHFDSMTPKNLLTCVGESATKTYALSRSAF
jgi:hypothetical protein